MRQGAVLTLLGIAIGAAASFALRNVVSGLLHGVGPTDAPTILVVLTLFAAVAFVAMYVPARRAAWLSRSRYKAKSPSQKKVCWRRLPRCVTW